MKLIMVSIFVSLIISLQANAQTHSSNLETYNSIFSEAELTLSKSVFQNCYLSEMNCGTPFSASLEIYVNALRSFRDKYYASLVDYESILGQDLYKAQRNEKEHFPLIFNVRWYGTTAAENESRVVDMMIDDVEFLLRNIILVEEELQPNLQNPMQYNEILLKSRSRLLPSRRLTEFFGRLNKNLPRTIEELRELKL